MKLYVNGCSFTHGHKDFGGVDPMRLDSPPTWVWPSVLQKDFNEVVNQAWSGTCNNRIVRRSIDFLSKVEKPKDWWIVIQWTSLERSEWFDNDTQSWYTQLLNRIVFDDWAKEGLTDQPRLDRRGEIAVPYVNEIRSDEHKILDFLYHIITLETFLKARGFNNVLYTSMSSNCDYRYHLDMIDESIAKDSMFANQYINKNSPNVHLFRQLATLIDEDKFLKPMSVITAGNEESAKDRHPNIEGHRIFSRYILNEMDKRV